MRHFESLDPRRHLSVTLDGSIVRVLGTAAADHFRMEMSPGGAYCYFFQKRADNSGWDNWSFKPEQFGTVHVRLGAGNDKWESSGPFDRLLWLAGEDGNDTLGGTVSVDHVFGGKGHDYISTGGGADFIQGGEGNDSILSGEGNDTVDGGLGNDAIFAAGGHDSIGGGAGDDWADGGLGDDSLRGETGNDELYGGDGFDLLHGGAGADLLDGGNQNDKVYGGADADTIASGTGNDLAFGEGGADVIRGDTGNDTVHAGAGNDLVVGGSGSDNLNGGEDHDRIDGGAGDDVVSGNAGNDTLVGGDGADRVYGNVGDDRLEGGKGDDLLMGDAGHDTLFGNAGNDSLFGGFGDDLLRGNAGNDRLDGSWGNDGLFGGLDFDTLRGGDGSDRFVQTYPTTALKQDVIDDRSAALDATMTFKNSGKTTRNFGGQTGSYTYDAGTFSEREIEVVDDALHVLHRATGNNKLLRMADGSAITFNRVGALIESTGGDFEAAGWNSGAGGVYFADESFDDDDAWAREVTFHEMGHFYDDEIDAAGWRALSGWVQQTNKPSGAYSKGLSKSVNWWHRTSAQFVSNYARTNPNEDFAESFANLFMNRAGWDFSRQTGVDISQIANKRDYLDDFVEGMRA